MENKEELQQKIDELDQKMDDLEERVKILEEKYDEIEFEDDEDYWVDDDDGEEDDSDDALWMVKIERKKANLIGLEHDTTFEKVFSTKKLAEKWLVKKGFVFGEPEMFNCSAPFWFHQCDNYRGTNHVELYKIYVDDFDEESWVDMLFYRHVDD